MKGLLADCNQSSPEPVHQVVRHFVSNTIVNCVDEAHKVFSDAELLEHLVHGDDRSVGDRCGDRLNEEVDALPLGRFPLAVAGATEQRPEVPFPPEQVGGGAPKAANKVRSQINEGPHPKEALFPRSHALLQHVPGEVVLIALRVPPLPGLDQGIALRPVSQTKVHLLTDLSPIELILLCFRLCVPRVDGLQELVGSGSMQVPFRIRHDGKHLFVTRDDGQKTQFDLGEIAVDVFVALRGNEHVAHHELLVLGRGFQTLRKRHVSAVFAVAHDVCINLRDLMEESAREPARHRPSDHPGVADSPVAIEICLAVLQVGADHLRAVAVQHHVSSEVSLRLDAGLNNVGQLILRRGKARDILLLCQVHTEHPHHKEGIKHLIR